MLEMFKNKYLVLQRLSICSFAIGILFRGFKYEIYFVEVDKMFRNLKIIKVLGKIGFKWIKAEYDSYSSASRGEYYLAVEFAEIIFKKLANESGILKNITKILSSKQEDMEDRIDVLWKSTIYQYIVEFAETCAAAEFLFNKNESSKIIIVTTSKLGLLCKDSLSHKIRIICLPSLRILRWIWNRLRRKCVSFMRKNMAHVAMKNAGHLKCSNSCSDKEARIENIEVAFFPHKGIYYGKLFMKDHFYSDDINSPLHISRILHISLGEKTEEYMLDSYKFYIERGVPFIDLHDLNYNKHKLGHEIYDLLKQIKFGLLVEWLRFGSDYLFSIFSSFIAVRNHYNRLSQLPSLKMALFGYDFLVSRQLSVACSLLGIKLCATQERFIQAFFPRNYSIIDYYFVAGRKVADDGLRNAQIENIIPIGLLRVDNIFAYKEKKIFDEKYDGIKRDKKLILALDYHLAMNELENIERYDAKIEYMRQFYEDLIRLAEEFKSIHIVIKGKDTKSYRTPYLKDIINRIEKIVNIDIELDLEKYSPYFISEKADLTIACHTSLADELIAAGRKVIFYETSDFMETVFDYEGLPIIVKDYDELKYHVEKVLKGIYLDKEIIDRLRKEFYSDCFHGKVKKKIVNKIEEILAAKKAGIISEKRS